MREREREAYRERERERDSLLIVIWLITRTTCCPKVMNRRREIHHEDFNYNTLQILLARMIRYIF
jgi:hypothetical protein